MRRRRKKWKLTGGWILYFIGVVVCFILGFWVAENDPDLAADPGAFGGGLVFLIAWTGLCGFVALLRMGGDEPVRHQEMGSARYLLVEDGAFSGWPLVPRSVRIGRLGSSRDLEELDGASPWLTTQGHLCTLAPTGTGKTTCAAMPNLRTYTGPAVVLDLKGELYQATAEARRKFGPVYLLDPFGVVDGERSRLGWLQGMDPEDESVVSDAERLAEMMVVREQEAAAGGSHWDDTAAELIRGVILYVLCDTDPAKRTMNTVRSVLTAHPTEWAATLDAMSKAGDWCFGAIQRPANAQLGREAKEGSAVLSTARRHTQWLDEPRLARSLADADIDLADLRPGGRGTLYLVVPPAQLHQASRWIRGHLIRILDNATRQLVSGDQARLLFLLDEFPALGRVRPIEQAIGVARGYGIQMWLFAQDLGQLRTHYGKDGTDTMLSNCSLQIGAVGDLETAKWISSYMGRWTQEVESRSYGSSSGSVSSGGSSSSSHSYQFQARDLMTPDEVLTMARSVQLALVAGQRPAWLDWRPGMPGPLTPEEARLPFEEWYRLHARASA